MINNLYIAYSDDFTYKVPITIYQLKDHIKIKEDKLTINPLPKQYHYKDKILNDNETHDFKIIKNEFYSDVNPKLVDKNGNQYEITNNELNQLNKERQ